MSSFSWRAGDRINYAAHTKNCIMYLLSCIDFFAGTSRNYGHDFEKLSTTEIRFCCFRLECTLKLTEIPWNKLSSSFQQSMDKEKGGPGDLALLTFSSCFCLKYFHEKEEGREGWGGTASHKRTAGHKSPFSLMRFPRTYQPRKMEGGMIFIPCKANWTTLRGKLICHSAVH